MNKRRLIGWIGIMGLVLIVFAVLGVAIGMNWFKKGQSLSDWGVDNRGLPVMRISLNDVTLSEIDENGTEIKYDGNKVELYDKGKVSEYDNVELKGRGNLSWAQPKKSYQIRFEKNENLLGLGREKKWVLLANYLDPTYLRNDVAFKVAEMVKEENSHRGDFVELYIDGDYRGLYYVVQKIEISKGSVDLRDNGGILFELDNLHRKPTEECNVTYLEECLILKDTVTGIVEEEENLKNEFMTDFNKAERFAKKGQYDEMAQLLDVESFAKYYLVNEFVVNPDAYSTSFFLYRNNQGTISAGPVWDFDLSLANPAWAWWTNENYFSPTVTMFRKDNAFGHGGTEEDLATSRLIYYMMDMPEFREVVKQVFREQMEGRENELINDVISEVNDIYWAAKKDGEIWKRKNFEEAVTKMLKWVQTRYRYFDEVYGDKIMEAV